MNRKQFLINEIADLVLDKLDEESKISRRIKHGFSKDFDFLSIVQDLERNEVLAKILIRLIDKKDYSSAYRTAIELYEVITEAFKEIGFVPGRVEPLRAEFKIHNLLHASSVSFLKALQSFVTQVKGPVDFSSLRHRNDTPYWKNKDDADYIVRTLSHIVSILETLKTENK